MLTRIDGIVTDIVRHTDRHNVVTLYTRQRGRMAFLVPVGKSKAGRMRNALLSYMSVVSADVNIREGKDIYTLRGVEPVRLWHAVYADPVKSSLLFFITEFCSRLLRQYPADERLWRFICESMETLDNTPPGRVANFHIAFLTGLLPLAGIEPNLEGFEAGMRFDMLSGEMVDTRRPGVPQRRRLLTEGESLRIPMLRRISYANMHLFRFSPSERRTALERILEYYASHLPIGSEYKSLAVLHEIFT